MASLFNGHGFGWTPGVGDGHRDLAAAVHGVAKSRTWLSDWTELNWTIRIWNHKNISLKIEHSHAIPLLGIYPREKKKKKSICLHRGLYRNFHHKYICNPWTENNPIFNNGWRKKQILMWPYNRLLLGNKMKWIIHTCNNILILISLCFMKEAKRHIIGWVNLHKIPEQSD